MRKDYKVSRRTRIEIKDIAGRCRRVFSLSESAIVRVIDVFRRLKRFELLKTGFVEIDFIVAVKGKAPAYVTYKPTTLHVDKEIWDLADIGEPYSNYILAHELGHVLMHDHSAQQFSGQNSQAWCEEESAEWQADTFADEFLLTDWQISNYVTPRDLSIYCQVDRELVNRRLGTKLKFTGESCQSCGDFRLVRSGTHLKCDSCGNMSCS